MKSILIVVLLVFVVVPATYIGIRSSSYSGAVESERHKEGAKIGDYLIVNGCVHDKLLLERMALENDISDKDLATLQEMKKLCERELAASVTDEEILPEEYKKIAKIASRDLNASCREVVLLIDLSYEDKVVTKKEYSDIIEKDTSCRKSLAKRALESAIKKRREVK